MNTSLIGRGEPIVGTAADADRCFMDTEMDVLVLENFVLLKKEQPDVETNQRDEYLAQFQLD